MKHVGQILRDARIKKGMSLIDVELKTKIKRQYVENIERGRWDKLPEYTVVCGFIKNLSSLFGLDPNKTMAFLKRDYPLAQSASNPKPDIKQKFAFSPRIAFALGVVAVLAVVSSYIYLQFNAFSAPPELMVAVPVEGQMVDGDIVKVLGKTNENSTLTINNQPVVVEDDGSFAFDLTLPVPTSEVVVKATSRSGKETIVTRKLNQN